MTRQVDDQNPARGFDRFAAAVADFGSPFYAEERQRDVWNEASALGLQVALWLGIFAATVMVWVGGSTGLPYSLGVLAVVGAASSLAQVYASRLGVTGLEGIPLVSRRLVLYLAVLLCYLAGLVRAALSTDSSFARGAAQGAALGAVIGFGAFVVGQRRHRKTHT